MSGTVLDDDNVPVIGANVLVEGTTRGTVTDIDGTYTIEVSPDEVLQFSYLGYSPQSVKISNQSSLIVTMAEDANQLDEVVVVGYGTRKRSHNTGSIAQVGGKDIAAIQANRVDDALAGKLPGV